MSGLDMASWQAEDGDQQLHEKFLLPALERIQAKDNIGALYIYEEMVNWLQENFVTNAESVPKFRVDPEMATSTSACV